MKRRLDLALALIHDPSILFLDEPTTGLDPQSRAALWEEVGRLARDEGVTVFLTTQYLEEADVLADRVGIIDHGHIVAEGTPAQLKAEIGKSTVEVVPEKPDELGRLASCSRRFGDETAARPGAFAVQLDGHGELPDVIRALDHGEPARRGDQPPPADTRRRLPREDRPHARGRRRRVTVAHQVALIAQRSLMRTARQPGVWIPPLTFPLMLMAVNSNGLNAATHLPGFPTHSFLAFFLPFSFMQGALFASGHRGHRPRARHRHRLPEPARADAGARRRAAARPDRRRASASAPCRRSSTWRRAARPACTSTPASAARSLILLLALLIAIGFGDARALDRAAHRLRRRRAVEVPAALLPAAASRA